MRRWWFIAGLCALVPCLGCSSDQLECVDVSAQCDNTFEPTYENVFGNILEPKCGVEGGACHSQQGAKNGLIFDGDADESHRLLVEEGRLISGDAACSEVVVRIEASDPALLMPPGSPLSAGERCTIIQWIEMGAPR